MKSRESPKGSKTGWNIDVYFEKKLKPLRRLILRYLYDVDRTVTAKEIFDVVFEGNCDLNSSFYLNLHDISRELRNTDTGEYFNIVILTHTSGNNIEMKISPEGKKAVEDYLHWSRK